MSTPFTPPGGPSDPGQPSEQTQPLPHAAPAPASSSAEPATAYPSPAPATAYPSPPPATAYAPAPAVAVAGDRDRPRTPWLALAGTATAAAVVASVATVGLTGVLDAGASQPASSGGPAQETVPVTSTTGQPDWQAVADAVRPAVVAIDVRTQGGAGQGSGVIIDAEGHVLTNDHVVGGAVDGGLQVTLHDGRVLEAEIVGTDPTTDLAVIRLLDLPADLAHARLGDSDGLAVGQAVMAVGNPLGLDSTVTTGIVSALDRPVTTAGQGSAVVTNAIQVDAAINPGNSGGPLFDANGRVVGITSSIATLSSGGRGGSIGLGFAIPVNLAQRVAAELVDDGAAEHAFLGVGLSDGTAEVDGQTRRGAVVEEVSDGSPAEEAGLRAGDVVVALGDDRVSGAESLTAAVRERAPGSTESLTVVRGGDVVDVDVVLAVRDESASERRRAPEQDRRAPEQDRRSPGSLPWDLFERG